MVNKNDVEFQMVQQDEEFTTGILLNNFRSYIFALKTFIMEHSCETTLASDRKAIIKHLLAILRFKRFMVVNSRKDEMFQ